MGIANYAHRNSRLTSFAGRLDFSREEFEPIERRTTCDPKRNAKIQKLFEGVLNKAESTVKDAKAKNAVKKKIKRQNSTAAK